MNDGGFFDLDDLRVIDRPEPRFPQCGRCGLYKGCQSPKMPPAGLGKRGIMVVGEAPGREEDRINKPFVGDSGNLVQRTFKKYDADLFRDCTVINALSCRPKDNKIEDRAAIEYCRPLVLKWINKYKPKSILLFGASAVKSVIGHVWDKKVEEIGRWVGFTIPCREWNCWITATYHPSYILRLNGYDPIVDRIFDGAVRTTIEKSASRPFKEIPNDEEEVKIYHDTDEAAEQIDSMRLSRQTVAWDIETTTLKPHGPHAKIYCCSIADCGGAIAYPWSGKAVTATLRLLQDPDVKKMGWNQQFEDVWLRVQHGIDVQGWVWDGMMAAHAQDSRALITGLKFQAFARLGVSAYNDYVEPYLKGTGGNGRNRIHEADLSKVLTYCALDSYYERKIGRQQMFEMGRLKRKPE